MKKKTLITSAAVAAIGTAAFLVGKKLVNRRRSNLDAEETSTGRGRHTTNTFSRAKQQAQNSPGE